MHGTDDAQDPDFIFEANDRDAVYDIPDGLAYPRHRRGYASARIVQEARARGITAGQHFASLLRRSATYNEAGSKLGIAGKSLRLYMDKYDVSYRTLAVGFGDRIRVRRVRLPKSAGQAAGK